MLYDVPSALQLKFFLHPALCIVHWQFASSNVVTLVSSWQPVNRLSTKNLQSKKYAQDKTKVAKTSRRRAIVRWLICNILFHNMAIH